MRLFILFWLSFAVLTATTEAQHALPRSLAPHLRAAGCTYIIQQGDTLTAIASRFSTSVAALLELNPQITNPDLIRAGDTLTICKDDGSNPSPSPSPNASPDPPPPKGSSSASQYVSKEQFERIFKHRDDPACSPGFYTYEALVKAMESFPSFASARSAVKNKRELAAFFAQIAQETTGGWPTAPDGPYAWGLCFKEEGGNGPKPTSSYCTPSAEFPCTPGKQYYGRGPLQISYNYNYGAAGARLGIDLLNNPELVSSDPVVAFQSALYFWMTPQPPKPSCHAVMQRKYVPTAEDMQAGRVLGFGWTTNIINGGVECGQGQVQGSQAGRLAHYRRFLRILGVTAGPNQDCANQQHY